jgi:hypothetical protein
MFLRMAVKRITSFFFEHPQVFESGAREVRLWLFPQAL